MENGFGKAVSRILFRPCGRRESFVSAASTRNPFAFANTERAAPGSPIWPCTRWGLPCLVAYASSGGLLHHLFTLTEVLANPAVYSLWHFPSGRLTASPPACIFGKTEVTRHRALRSSDFPPPSRRSGIEAILRLSKTALIIPKKLRGAMMESSKPQVQRVD